MERVGRLEGAFEQLDQRLGDIQAALHRLDGRFERVEARMDRLDARMDHLEARIDAQFRTTMVVMATSGIAVAGAIFTLALRI